MKIDIDEYILMFLKNNPCKIPSVKFWGLTLLMIKTRAITIRMKNGHYLTEKDCFKEMNDCASGDCYRNSYPPKWLKQKRKYYGW